MLVQYQNLPVQNIPALLLSCGFLAILFRSLVLRVRYYRKAQAWGCKPVPSRFQWDPFWGLDLVWSQWKALRGHYYIPWLSDLHKGQPKTFQITFQGARVIHTIEPENLKCLTAINWKDFGISPLRRGKKAGHPFADRGVNSVDGEDWVFSRSLIKPFFMREVYANTERLLPHPDHLLRIMPPDGETFNIQPYLQRWFLDVTTQFIFGAPMDALTHPERARVTWAMLDVLRGTRLRLQLYRVMHLIDWSWWLRAIKIIHEFMDERIDRVYADIAQHQKRIQAGEDVGPERLDLLWHMALGCPDHVELRSQLSLLFVPNNDTTSILTANVIWHLARNSKAWGKVRAEVLAHGDAPLTFEALRGMKYLQASINETHRLNPNNVTQVRMCVNDTTLPLGGGTDGRSPILIRKGDIVQVTKTVMQKDPLYWGEDPDVYRPERFEEKTHFWEFVPFGGGPRRCPAHMMVQTESAYLIARLAQVYSRIEPRDENPFISAMRIGPSNKTGVLVALHK
ncbi:Cytochrome monooxygenase apdE [Penicillium oxalicum]|uniref:Cytochrome monooxygenase apdE n=1 Tax=Penicillium oxalicum TaxID=69781 RepID=UPI0020B65CB4|nr:Cytochrome monooxygenase apdE [Penicillium oxalicum]KAI2791889.1 Cytochrome monooxygenase apdE [Penicillium oxalicum]